MKNTVINTASLFVLTLVVSISASAQMSSSYKAEVPFDFTVGGKTLAAGEYRIERTNPQSKNGQVTIRNTRTRNAHIFNTLESGEATRSAKLVFTNVDGEYFLAAISTANLSARFTQNTRRPETADQIFVALKPAK